MEAKAYLKYLRISPRKVKIVLDLIRGKDADVAMAILKNTPKAASPEIAKLLKSAMANGEHNFGMDPAKFYVSECFVCPGPTLKRFQARAKGSGDRILKRTSHVTLAVSEREDKERA
jgi:large subunit ribosomal protein L22